MSAVTAVLPLESICCASCAMEFAAPARFIADRRSDHKNFYCPAGHSNWYPGKSEKEQLQQQLEAERQRANRAESARKWAEQQAKNARVSAGMHKAAKKRLEHRVNCGVCPHCQRTFKQLAAHIKSKHPKAVTRGER